MSSGDRKVQSISNSTPLSFSDLCDPCQCSLAQFNFLHWDLFAEINKQRYLPSTRYRLFVVCLCIVVHGLFQNRSHAIPHLGKESERISRRALATSTHDQRAFIGKDQIAAVKYSQHDSSSERRHQIDGENTYLSIVCVDTNTYMLMRFEFGQKKGSGALHFSLRLAPGVL